jgi:nucleolar complex protein 2
MDEGESSKPAATNEAKELTLPLLQSLEKSALGGKSLKGLRKLVQAFKSASLMADDSRVGGRGEAGGYRIVSPAVFDRLLTSCLRDVPDVLGHHLLQKSDFSTTDPTEFAKIKSLPQWRTLESMVYRLLKALLHILGQVTDASLVAFMLQSLERFVPFMIPFPQLAKRYLRALLGKWSTAEAASVKVPAFLRIHQLAMMMPFPFVENCLKGLYLSYVQNAKFVNETTLPSLTFMGNCLVGQRTGQVTHPPSS